MVQFYSVLSPTNKTISRVQSIFNFKIWLKLPQFWLSFICFLNWHSQMLSKPVMLPSGISIEKLEILWLALLYVEKRTICQKKLLAIDLICGFNMFKMWRSLNKILPTKKNEGNSLTEIGANSFNTFFAEIGEKLTEQFNSTSKYPEISGVRPSCSFSFSKIPSIFVYRYLVNLSDKRCLDIINFDNIMVKHAAPAICNILTHLFQLIYFYSHCAIRLEKGYGNPHLQEQRV